MTEASREMSIQEWCAKLPPEHRVNRELIELMDDSAFLNALRATGVDNWIGYDHACELYQEDAES